MAPELPSDDVFLVFWVAVVVVVVVVVVVLVGVSQLPDQVRV